MAVTVTAAGVVSLKGETTASILIVQTPGASAAKLVAIVPGRTASYQLPAGSYAPGDVVSRLPATGMISAVIPGVTPPTPLTSPTVT